MMAVIFFKSKLNSITDQSLTVVNHFQETKIPLNNNKLNVYQFLYCFKYFIADFQNLIAFLCNKLDSHLQFNENRKTSLNCNIIAMIKIQ